jgi:nucleoside-diphosphate-sugar epimerase
MRIVIIGGTGHIGSYLVPALVRGGHDVVCVARGVSTPYFADPAWERVEHCHADRDALDKDGAFGALVAGHRPGAVIDLTCFMPDSARHMLQALRGGGAHLLHCGSVWAYGPRSGAPLDETAPRAPYGVYAEWKAQIEALLLAQDTVAATVIHPGQIAGRYWWPVNPAGNLNPGVFAQLARGEPLALPDGGRATLHFAHASDIADAFMRALEARGIAAGHSFNVASPLPVPLRDYAQEVAAWHGQHWRPAPGDWRQYYSAQEVQFAEYFVKYNTGCDSGKAQRLLGWRAAYDGLEAAGEGILHLLAPRAQSGL